MGLRYSGNVTRFEDGLGTIDTHDKAIGIVFVSWQNIRSSGTKKLEVHDTVEFSLFKDEENYFWAIDVNVIDRNAVKYSTEDKASWCREAEVLEREFVRDIAPKINRTLIINPEKALDPTVIDLYNPIQNYYADLKSPRTPYFTSSTYGFDPTYTVTFNRKDYLRYKKLYPSAIIYWHVRWDQLSLGERKVEPLEGVWEVPFSYMAKVIEEGMAPLHPYKYRKTDEVNAKDSYLFNLNTFPRLL